MLRDVENKPCMSEDGESWLTENAAVTLPPAVGGE